jgi:hypothetical protein
MFGLVLCLAIFLRLPGIDQTSSKMVSMADFSLDQLSPARPEVTLYVSPIGGLGNTLRSLGELVKRQSGTRSKCGSPFEDFV